MSEEQIKALWRRTDDHAKEIGEIKNLTGILQVRQTDTDARFDRFLQEQANGRAEILAQLKVYDERVQEITRQHWREEGINAWKKWAIPVGVSICAIMVSLGVIAIK